MNDDELREMSDADLAIEYSRTVRERTDAYNSWAESVETLVELDYYIQLVLDEIVRRWLYKQGIKE